MSPSKDTAHEEETDDFESLYLQAYLEYLQAPTVCSQTFFAFEMHVYETVGCLSPATIDKLKELAKGPSLN